MSTKKISEIADKATSAEIGDAKLVAAIPSGDGHVTKYIEGNDLAYSMSPGMTIMEIKTINDGTLGSNTTQNFANWQTGDKFYFSEQNEGWIEVPEDHPSYYDTANGRVQVYPVSANGDFVLKHDGNVNDMTARNYIHLRASASLVSGGPSSTEIGYFKTRSANIDTQGGGTNWASYAVGIEVDPNKTYKLINLMNYCLQGNLLSGSTYDNTHSRFQAVHIGATIPTVDSNFRLDHHAPVARTEGWTGLYAFIRNNVTGLVYGEGTILGGTTQNPSQRTTYEVTNKSIMYVLLEYQFGQGTETDVIAHLEVS